METEKRIGDFRVNRKVSWAATPEIAADAHRYIRMCAAERFSMPAAQAARILYGGSVKPDNAVSLFGQPDIDGGLIGRVIEGCRVHRHLPRRHVSFWRALQCNGY